MNHPFTRLKSTRRSGRKIVTCDIETWGLAARPSDFALGVVFDGEQAKRFSDVSEMRRFLLGTSEEQTFSLRKAAVYAHNGGKFDYLAIFGNYWLTFGPQQVIMNDGRLIQIKYVKSPRYWTYFRDSLNYLPTTLKRLGEKFGDGLEKGETPQKFIDGDRAAGINENDFEYCERDCRVLHRALTYLQTTVGPLRATLPSTAMATYRREFFPDPSGEIWVRRDLDVLFRAAYYGGRVESYLLGGLNEAFYIWDVNSLYPAAMVSTAFPDPSRLRPSKVLDLSQEGFAEVTISHPNTEIGYLPVRAKSGKLIFPTGTFRGSWTFPELRLALSKGASIQNVYQVVSASPIESPFKAYVEKYYAMKESAQTPWEREIAKLMLNALYGKFCEFHGTQEEYASEYKEEVHAEYRAKWGECEWKPINHSRPDGYYSFPSRDGGMVPHAIYCWGAYVTARARVLNASIQDRIRSIGGKVAYTDTDSFTSQATIAALIPTGANLGELKLVTCDECKQPFIVKWVGGNKYYRKFCACGDKTIQKGVRHNKETVYGENGSASWKSVVGLKEAIRRNLEPGSPLMRTRSSHVEYDKRVVHADGSTKPIRLSIL
jgi:hypothetical protein